MDSKQGLERRSLPPQPGKWSNKKHLVLTSASFRQNLIKYCQRQARRARPFSLACLNILQYDCVLQTLGKSAADQLNNLVLDTCLKNTRDADRLCIVRPGHFLLLLPDTKARDAARIMDRLCALIASSKIHYKHSPLSASCTSLVADSIECGADLEAMLNNLQYKIDEAGAFVLAGWQESQAAYHLPFSSGFPAWLERYRISNQGKERQVDGNWKVADFEAHDLWHNQSAVRMRCLEPIQSVDMHDLSILAALTKRLKVLQLIDHPGVDFLIDFHLKDFHTLYLVKKVLDGVSLATYLDRITELPCAAMMDFSLQLCNAIIYLQSLVPPVVPNVVDIDSFCVLDGKRLILTDYELPYLFPQRYRQTVLHDEDVKAAAQGRPIAAYGPAIKGLARLLTVLLGKSSDKIEQLTCLINQLKLDVLPRKLNTIYKIRAELREIAQASRLVLTVA